MKSCARILVVGALILHAFSHFGYADDPAAVTDCPSAWQTLAKIGYHTTVTPTKHVGKVGIYPGLLLYKTAFPVLHKLWEWKPKEAGKIIAETLWADKYHAGFALLGAFLYRSTGISVNQYMQATAEFDDADPDELTVVVDAFSPQDLLYSGGGTYANQSHYQGKRNVVLINNVNSWEEIFDKLAIVVKERGRIKKLDFYAHGLPGRSIGGMRDQTSYPGMTDKGEEELFQKDAKIRFVSCFVGNGSEGAEFFEHLPMYLTPLGATVWTSKVQVVPNLLELAAFKTGAPAPPQWMRDAAEPLSGILGYWTALSMAEMHLFKEKDATVEGPLVWNRTRKTVILPYRDLGEVPDGERAEFMQDAYITRGSSLAQLSRHWNSVGTERERLTKIYPGLKENRVELERQLKDFGAEQIRKFGELRYTSPAEPKYFRFARRDTPTILSMYQRLETENRNWLTPEKLLDSHVGLDWVRRQVEAGKRDIDGEYELAAKALMTRKDLGYLDDSHYARELGATQKARDFFKARIERLGTIAEEVVLQKRDLYHRPSTINDSSK